MTTPRISYITANIETVLELISGMTVARTKRTDFDDITPGEGYILMLVNNVSLNEGGAGNADTYDAEIILRTFIYDVSGGSSEIDDRISDQAMTIVKQLYLDRTRGGYALNTTINNIDYLYAQDGCGAQITVTIKFRTAFGDPYTGR